MKHISLLAFSFILLSQNTFATIDEVDTAFFQNDLMNQNFENENSTAVGQLPKFQKKIEILNHFGVQKELPPTELLLSRNGKQSSAEFLRLKKYFDPKFELDKYITIQSDSLSLFLDRDEKQYKDLDISFSKSDYFENSKKSFQGLRVAIDPGHMGGDFWDKETGKYVEINHARVSEGEIALITSKLVAEKLNALGAETMITHEQLGPVSTLNYRDFILKPFALDQFYKESDQPWFEGLVNQTDDLPSLVNLFLNHPITKKIFSENFRSYIFIFKADLMARAEMINAFKPDITLVVHYDASELDKLQKSVQGVKTYVPGGVLSSELPSQKYRYQYLSQMLSANRWNQSVHLSEKISQAISQEMQIPIEKNPDLSREFYVKDGVFARNLNLNRENLFGAISYLECMHYDFETEFYRLIKKDKEIKIGNQTLKYSTRLDQMSEAIVVGLSNYLSEAN